MLYLLKRVSFLFLLISRVCFAEACSMPPEMPNKSYSSQPELLIFVSFNMPKQSLKLLVEQAKRVNAKLLLRGFLENSLQKTTAKTMEILDEKGEGEFLVDPEAFEKFNIRAVPAVVIVQPDTCLEENCPAPLFDVVYGDTPLEEALERIKEKGSKEGQATAKNYLAKYRATRG